MTPTIRTEYTDVLSLSPAAYRRWEEGTHRINHALFGRPLSAIHLHRDKACLLRAVQYYAGATCVGRANLTIYPVRAFDPSRGREAPMYACVGGGGVLPEYDDRVQVHPFAFRAVAAFHARNPLSRRSVYLLATNVSPLASFLLARYMPRVSPVAGRAADGHMERLRRELVRLLYPRKYEGFCRTGLIAGPPLRCSVPPLRTSNPLLHRYVAMHGDWRGGARLPMLVRMNKRDLLEGARRLATLALAKRAGFHDPDRVAPYTVTEIARRLTAPPRRTPLPSQTPTPSP